MATITLTFEDTPAMRDALRTLGTHAVDDNVAACESDAEEFLFLDPDCETAPKLEALAEAYTAFNDEVTRALWVPDV